MITVAYCCRRASADIINSENGSWLNRGLGKRVDQSEHRAATGRHPEQTGEPSPSTAR